MLDVTVNEPGVRTLFLESLNRCFPGWGGEEQYDWAFGGTVGGPGADLIVIRENGALLAGTGLTYRRLKVASGRDSLCGILTGAWTLPEARGRGCFTRAVAEAVTVTAERGGGVVFGFVRENNISWRRMRDIGSGMFPSYYLFADAEALPPHPGKTTPVEVVPPTEEKLSRFAVLREAASASGTRVAYDAAGFRRQFVDRQGATELLRIGDSGWALTETKGQTMVIQGTALEESASVGDLWKSLLARARDRNHNLVGFTTFPSVADECASLGFRVTSGSVAELIADRTLLSLALGVDAPLEGVASTVLANPASQFFLGNLIIESGDRM